MVELDPIDAAIVRELRDDARLANNVLAARVGIAPSTCHGRVRALFERGVIRGAHAEIDQASIGRPLQAMISVRLRPHARGELSAFAHAMSTLPEVLNVYFLAGADDFLIHVATAGSEELREFVLHHLSGTKDVAMTETSLIFEHLRGNQVAAQASAQRPAQA
ncbi:Lrp/AsnC family transcriptional regulator [Pimelobacter simplex]|uniref:Lrp/AsnC family transcriptional regulator n=1 Tax=Nocardioides simplex TaxID=2045 RepID=A0A4Y3N144_NOCSI|nr:Lrp/AsnC family transcriptional regulator [Pimelobacter simplex]KAB2811547.1 Lrp/AsnC family transcriptional regulator [Pimelobacter simplex]MCG8149708.1 AsnC family transcriptional regulator [Pimelobacter simplex]GEB14075.1 putative transcriptional regulator, AsnC family protein [Pimelobacter simplex]SFM64233.1 DNA-binding transcriptional regulator, Lrp family [Pimelobacter simplex]